MNTKIKVIVTGATGMVGEGEGQNRKRFKAGPGHDKLHFVWLR